MTNPPEDHFVSLKVNAKIKNLLIHFLLNADNLQIVFILSSFHTESFLMNSSLLPIQAFLFIGSFLELKIDIFIYKDY